jgi:hypothetical protein
MRSVPLAVVAALCLAGSASAQTPPPGKPPPNHPPGKVPPAMPPPVAPPEDPAANVKPELLAPFNISMEFFGGVIHHDLDTLVSYSRTPFSFDGHTVNSPDEVKKRWTHILAELGRTNATLYGLEVLPYDDMVKKYGKPPAKLNDINWKGSVVAVGNIDGRATLAVLRRDTNGAWRVFAFSD